MKIALLGATGRTGRYILRDALGAGHSVSVLVRNPAKLPPGKYKLTIHLGDATDADNVDDTIYGQEAVISALGLDANGKSGTVSSAIAHIIESMRANSVRRLVVISGAGILTDGKSGALRMEAPTYPPDYRVYAEEHLRVYQALQSSGLDWTLVCPLTMRDEPPSAELRTEADQLPPHGKSATYAGVAQFALALLGGENYFHQRVGVAE